MLRANAVLQERRANARMISFLCRAHISFVFLCSVHISVVIPTAEKAYWDGCLQTSQLQHLDIVSHLRRLEAAIAIATLWGIVSQLRRLPPNVAIATLFLSVIIATLFSKH